MSLRSAAIAGYTERPCFRAIASCLNDIFLFVIFTKIPPQIQLFPDKKHILNSISIRI
ncbi:hypothetical protein ABID99_002403 [Mucilaginibacter sp. OAE612]|jgi:hypothetical protein